jgi:hypothetical protein
MSKITHELSAQGPLLWEPKSEEKHGIGIMAAYLELADTQVCGSTFSKAFSRQAVLY